MYVAESLWLLTHDITALTHLVDLLTIYHDPKLFGPIHHANCCAILIEIGEPAREILIRHKERDRITKILEKYLSMCVSDENRYNRIKQVYQWLKSSRK